MLDYWASATSISDGAFFTPANKLGAEKDTPNWERIKKLSRDSNNSQRSSTATEIWNKIKMCRILIALGDVQLNSIFEGIKFMAQDEGKATAKMVPDITDKKLQRLFITRGTKHGDGWGMAFLQDQEIMIKKSQEPIYEESQSKEIQNINTNFIMLHARFKTVGENKLENNAPFQNGEYVFCHNGTIKQEILFNKEKFSPLGDTDSERLFLSILSKNLPIEKAIKVTFEEIILKPNSNIFLSNRNTTYVYSSSRTLPNYFRMYIGKGESCLVISSEKLPQLDVKWEEVPFEKVIEINHKTLEITQH